MEDTSISNIISQINALQNSQQKPGAREQLLVLAHQLVAAIETPSEFISRTGWSEPASSACVRTAVDLKLFEKLSTFDNNEASTEELANATGADLGLIERLLKHLTATNIIAERKQGVFALTDMSSQLVEPKYRDGLIYCYDVAGPSFRDMPSFFKKTAYKQPLNPVDGPFQYAHKTEKHFFPWLNANLNYLGAFANYMTGYRAGKLSWADKQFYPVEHNLIDAADKGSIFLVDVGGGKGHDLVELLQLHPQLPGRLVLQDKSETIASIEQPLPEKIEATVHDFFTEQPVKGARAYYLHSVLHDWDDESCIKILQQLKPAMKQGYSKLLVNDLIVPNTGAVWSVTSMDWLMMALGSVRERTETDFRILIEKAGYKVEKIWTIEQGTESIIEAVPV